MDGVAIEGPLPPLTKIDDDVEEFLRILGYFKLSTMVCVLGDD